MEKYKVVQVCESDPTIVKIRILTLGRGSGYKSFDDDYSWRDIAVPTPERYEELYNDFRHIYLNGFFNWIIETWALIPTNTGTRRFEPGPIKPYILGLDTSRETFFKIKLPDEVSTLYHHSKNLNEMGGSLCLSQYFSYPIIEFKIWILKKKDHEDEDEWLETFKINMTNSIGNFDIKLFNMIKILAVLTVPKLKLIIVNTSPSSVSTYLSYDVESKELEIIHEPTESYALTFIHWHVNNIPNW